MIGGAGDRALLWEIPRDDYPVEQRLAQQAKQWSPPAPAGADITLDGDEVYTCVGGNRSGG